MPKFVGLEAMRGQEWVEAAMGGDDEKDACKIVVVFEGSDGAGKGVVGEIMDDLVLFASTIGDLDVDVCCVFSGGGSSRGKFLFSF